MDKQTCPKNQKKILTFLKMIIPLVQKRLQTSSESLSSELTMLIAQYLDFQNHYIAMDMLKGKLAVILLDSRFIHTNAEEKREKNKQK